ncbi:MAG: hypothetical protein EAZ85_02000 [Bacteroidetes bacterium]|nr:MAG: hypothetical protein EAZ85_02000 [Bacteroidota bacterium]TAG92107.1 MAG: hypothetical protein EAZ20_02785 [Bacteroidota bacterium]
MNEKIISYQNFYEIIHEDILPQIASWQIQKHRIFKENQNEKISYHLPLLIDEILENQSFKDFLLQIPPFPNDYIVLLIQAGSAVIGQYEEGKLVNHKVIKKYMVRAAQGKAQLKHLNSKGKSKLGSRIRLAQTKDFFEEINQKLEEWEITNIPFIFYSGSIDCWNLLFESKINCPFEKKDKRLRKVPLLVHTPDFEELLRINEFILNAKKETKEFFL